MKRSKILLITTLVLTAIIFSGCAKKTDNNSEKNNIVKIDNNSEKTDNTVENKNNGSYAYKFDSETDCQADIGEYPMEAYTKNGYYSLQSLNDSTSSKMLYYYDYSSQQSVLVCGKTNCQHIDDTCDAFFDGEEYPVSSIWYYKGNVYIPSLDGDYLCITKISPDGSTREKVCSVARIMQKTEDEDGATSTATYYPSMVLHCGNIYYTNSYPGSKKAEIYKKALEDNSDAVKLDEVEGDSVQIYRVKAYGDNIFYQKAVFGEDGTVTDGGIYVYNSSESKSSVIVKDAVSYYCLDESGNIYYHDNDKNAIMKIDTNGQTDTYYELGAEDCNGFLWDGDRFVVYTISDIAEKQYIMDQEGNITKTIDEYDKFEKPYQSIRDK